jgi:hypothetical protein
MSDWPNAQNPNVVIFFKHGTIPSLGALMTEVLVKTGWSNAGVH